MFSDRVAETREACNHSRLCGAYYNYLSLAQRIERLATNQMVARSNRACETIINMALSYIWCRKNKRKDEENNDNYERESY